MTSSYYDIDAILAEEELIPVTTLLDFQYLSFLDPDCDYDKPASIISPPSNVSDDDEQKRAAKPKKRMSKNNYLPEDTKFKMPLWSIEKWCELSFVRLGLPRHFCRRARERLEADPAAVDLRRKSERFYMSGMFLVNLIKRCVSAFNKSRKTSRQNPRALTEISEIDRESNELKHTLLLTYTGVRLRRTFDWTLSNIEDDVSAYTERLTEMERQLFQKAAAASHADVMWKLHGSRRIHVSTTALRAKAMQTVARTMKTPVQGRKRRIGNIVSPDEGRNNIIRSRSSSATVF